MFANNFPCISKYNNIHLIKSTLISIDRLSESYPVCHNSEVHVVCRDIKYEQVSYNAATANMPNVVCRQHVKKNLNYSFCDLVAQIKV